MDKRQENATAVQRTTLNPDKDSVELGLWVAPIKCEGCGGRVDTFYQWRNPDDARCNGCGSEWRLE